MTQTVQSRSYVLLNYSRKDLNRKPEAEDNISLLLSVFDSLNKLYENLNRLNYIVQRKNIEQILYQKSRGEIVSALRSL